MEAFQLGIYLPMEWLGYMVGRHWQFFNDIHLHSRHYFLKLLATPHSLQHIVWSFIPQCALFIVISTVK